MTMRHCTIGLDADAGRVFYNKSRQPKRMCVYIPHTVHGTLHLRIIYRTLHTTLAPETALPNFAVN